MSRQQQRLTYYDMVQQIESITLDLNIVGGRNLVPKDRNAMGKYTSSDPYVMIFLAGERVHKTKVIPKTLNPTWTEAEGSSFQTKLVGQNARDLLRHSNPLQFVIYDKDQIGDDDSMGVICYPINIHPTAGASQGNNEEGEGTWLQVQTGDSSSPHYCKNACGELLVQISYETEKKTSVFDDINIQPESDHGQKRLQRGSSSRKIRKSSSGCDLRSPKAGPARRCRSIDDPWNWVSSTPRTPRQSLSKGHETRPDALKSSSHHNKTPKATPKSSRYLMSMEDSKTPTATPLRAMSSRQLMSREDSKTPTVTPRRSRSSRYLMSMDPLRNSSHHGEGNQHETPTLQRRKSSLMMNGSGDSPGEETPSSHRRRHPLRSKEPQRNSSHDSRRQERSSSHSRRRSSSSDPMKKRRQHKKVEGMSSSTHSHRRSSSLDPMKKRRQHKKVEETSSSSHSRRRSSSPSRRRSSRSGQDKSLEDTLRRSSSKDPSRRRRSSKHNKTLTSPTGGRLIAALGLVS